LRQTDHGNFTYWFRSRFSPTENSMVLPQGMVNIGCHTTSPYQWGKVISIRNGEELGEKKCCATMTRCRKDSRYGQSKVAVCHACEKGHNARSYNHQLKTNIITLVDSRQGLVKTCVLNCAPDFNIFNWVSYIDTFSCELT
jgi:hypothetical protein